MAEFLVQLVNIRSGRFAGEVAVVVEDGHEWSLRERLWYGIVRCPEITVEEGSSIYCAEGCPDEVAFAAKDAAKALMEDESSTELRQAFTDAKEAADGNKWPRRRYLLDISIIPPEVISRVQAGWQKKLDVAEEAQAEAKAAVVELLETRLRRRLTPAEAARKTMDWIKSLMLTADIERAAGMPDSPAQSLVAAIAKASKDGREVIEDVEFAKVAIPEPIDLTRKQLDEATIPVDVDAWRKEFAK